MNPEPRAPICRFRPLLGFLLLAFAMALPGQDDGCDPGRRVAGGAMDESTYRQLNTAFQAVEQGNYDDAFEDLDRLLRRAGGDSYLRAVLKQAMAQVEWSRGNHDSALDYFEAAIALDALPNQAHFALMYQVAQLYYMQERYSEAGERLGLWFCAAPEEKVTADAYVLEASIQTSLEDYPRALAAIETAIGMESEPRKQWYQLKLAMHYRMDHFPEAARTLEFMVAQWPAGRQYWVQLSQLYLVLEQADRALATLALAYRNGLLDSGHEIETLSGLYSMNGVPYKSAEVLQLGIERAIVAENRENWERVADQWYAAEELDKSLQAYERAGRESEDGDIDLRRAYILVELERWQGAKLALDAAIGKGGLDERRLAEAYLLRGVTQFKLDNFDQADADWRSASRESRTQAAAEQWLAHLRDERRGEDP